MPEYGLVLLLAALPAIGNFAGGLLAEWLGFSRRALSLALHAAAGIIIAVISVELMPEVLTAEPPWVVVVAFLLGGLFSIGLDKLVDVAQTRRGKGQENTSVWMIYIGVATDLFSDGLIIGAGTTVSPGLGTLLALGQVPADLPEGYATIASFRSTGTPRSQRLWLSLSFAVPILLGATLGYWLVRGQPEIFKLSLLAFTAAILVTAATEDIIGFAHETREDTLWHELVFIVGFALFMMLSVYFD